MLLLLLCLNELCIFVCIFSAVIIVAAVAVTVVTTVAAAVAVVVIVVPVAAHYSCGSLETLVTGRCRVIVRGRWSRRK